MRLSAFIDLRVMNNTPDLGHMLAPFQASPRTLADGKAIA
jgi:hypothetical protein